ncbi:MAG: hypothetical protein GY874_02375 [Desulfobacteraceae bacterium]|nr:hypothetical protein [Desulfobacteraceae bacterium]
MKDLVLVVFFIFFVSSSLIVATPWAAQDVELAGVRLPAQKTVAGKSVKLNGVALRKALGFVKVYVAGLYLEKPSKDSNEVIISEQVKYLETHYLTSKATAKKLKNGFIDLMKDCNSSEMFERNKADIELYASWLNKDMAPGLISSSTYIPGKGITLEYQGQIKGTINNPEFVKMYYNYNVGQKADKKIRKALLGN